MPRKAGQLAVDRDRRKRKSNPTIVDHPDDRRKIHGPPVVVDFALSLYFGENRYSMRTGDTITAICSPPGRSARGILRISGPNAFEIIESTLKTDATQQPIDFTRGIRRAHLQLGAASTLPCLVAIYPSPHSYTAEDTVEIITAGNPHLLNRLIQEMVIRGARPAEPGEFTARAYFNGRITLAQAEGVAQTIAAASDAHLRAAQILTDGTLGNLCRKLSTRLSRALALLEAGIDFVDQEDVVPISRDDLASEIEAVITDIDELTRHALGMEQLSALPRVVLVGPPNAGKSTLFNALLGRERAVVSPVRGTTRDALVEPIHLEPDDDGFGAEILLIDPAGLNENDSESDDFFAPAMQQAARQAIRQADLLLYLHPADQRDETRNDASGDASGYEVYGDLLDPFERAGKVIHVRSKSDVKESENEDDHFDVTISAFTGSNLNRLRAILAEHLQKRMTTLSADAVALQPRHEAALASTRKGLSQAAKMLRETVGQVESNSAINDAELIAVSMRSSLNALGRITGDEVTPDDVLGHIFAHFCVGK